MKTLFDYLSKDNQDRLIEYANEHNLPVGQVKVQEHYNSPLYSINAVGTTGARQYQQITVRNTVAASG